MIFGGLPMIVALRDAAARRARHRATESRRWFLTTDDHAARLVPHAVQDVAESGK